MNKELITRREAVALAAAMVPAASGQRQFGSMLWDYIREYTRLLDERRARRLASLESEDDFLALRDTVRGALKEMWGPFPERTPLNAKHVGTVECGDHIIERLVYESRPSFPRHRQPLPPDGSRRRPSGGHISVRPRRGRQDGGDLSSVRHADGPQRICRADLGSVGSGRAPPVSRA